MFSFYSKLEAFNKILDLLDITVVGKWHYKAEQLSRMSFIKINKVIKKVIFLMNPNKVWSNIKSNINFHFFF